MANLNTIIRRSSSMIDTSGAMPPVLTSLRTESGVYTGAATDAAHDELSKILTGRISLSIVAALIIGAGGFYYYTRSIQGGG